MTIIIRRRGEPDPAATHKPTSTEIARRSKYLKPTLREALPPRRNISRRPDAPGSPEPPRYEAAPSLPDGPGPQTPRPASSLRASLRAERALRARRSNAARPTAEAPRVYRSFPDRRTASPAASRPRSPIARLRASRPPQSRARPSRPPRRARLRAIP